MSYNRAKVLAVVSANPATFVAKQAVVCLYQGKILVWGFDLNRGFVIGLFVSVFSPDCFFYWFMVEKMKLISKLFSLFLLSLLKP